MHFVIDSLNRLAKTPDQDQKAPGQDQLLKPYVLPNIAEHLDGLSLLNLGLTCRGIRDAVTTSNWSNRVWKRIYNQRFEQIATHFEQFATHGARYFFEWRYQMRRAQLVKQVATRVTIPCPVNGRPTNSGVIRRHGRERYVWWSTARSYLVRDLDHAMGSSLRILDCQSLRAGRPLKVTDRYFTACCDVEENGTCVVLIWDRHFGGSQPIKRSPNVPVIEDSFLRTVSGADGTLICYCARTETSLRTWDHNTDTLLEPRTIAPGYQSITPVWSLNRSDVVAYNNEQSAQLMTIQCSHEGGAQINIWPVPKNAAQIWGEARYGDSLFTAFRGDNQAVVAVADLSSRKYRRKWSFSYSYSKTMSLTPLSHDSAVLVQVGFNNFDTRVLTHVLKADGSVQSFSAYRESFSLESSVWGVYGDQVVLNDGWIIDLNSGALTQVKTNGNTSKMPMSVLDPMDYNYSFLTFSGAKKNRIK